MQAGRGWRVPTWGDSCTGLGSLGGSQRLLPTTHPPLLPTQTPPFSTSSTELPAPAPVATLAASPQQATAPAALGTWSQVPAPPAPRLWHQRLRFFPMSASSRGTTQTGRASRVAAGLGSPGTPQRQPALQAAPRLGTGARPSLAHRAALYHTSVPAYRQRANPAGSSLPRPPLHSANTHPTWSRSPCNRPYVDHMCPGCRD